MTKKTEPVEVVGTPPAEEARLTREQTTGDPRTDGEIEAADQLESVQNAVVNRGEEALQGRDANARMEMTDAATNPPADPGADVDKRNKYTERFCKLTGYKVADVAAVNLDTQVFVTSSGGKYRLIDKGTKIQHLSGPVPPIMREQD